MCVAREKGERSAPAPAPASQPPPSPSCSPRRERLRREAPAASRAAATASATASSEKGGASPRLPSSAPPAPAAAQAAASAGAPAGAPASVPAAEGPLIFTFERPAPAIAPSTVVAQVFPTAAVAPQNLLLSDPGPRDMFDDRVYKRGALTLHALRGAIGDDKFFALLRDWTGRHRHGWLHGLVDVDYRPAVQSRPYTFRDQVRRGM